MSDKVISIFPKSTAKEIRKSLGITKEDEEAAKKAMDEVAEHGKIFEEKGELFQLPHLHGDTICLQCGDKNYSKAPIGTVFMKCWRCQTEKVVFSYPIGRNDVDHWECKCGNRLFLLTKHGPYCPKCGVYQTGWEDKH